MIGQGCNRCFDLSGFGFLCLHLKLGSLQRRDEVLLPLEAALLRIFADVVARERHEIWLFDQIGLGLHVGWEKELVGPALQ